MNPENRAAAEKAAELLSQADSALFITGAGVSVESGLPTYRGVGGLYAQVDPDEGLPIEQILSGPYFRRHPEVGWKYLRQMEEAARGKTHNQTHQLIADLERVIQRVVVLTQNVDGFHREAGSTHVIDIHGDVKVLRCTECVWRRRFEDYAELGALPYCPTCGAVARPDVVLFEEMLPPGKVARMQAELEDGFDVVFSIGTSSLFPYIAGPVIDAAEHGVPTVEINPERTVVSETVQVRIAAPAGEAMAAICETLLP